MALVEITVTGVYMDAGGNLLKGKTLYFTPLSVFGDGGDIIPKKTVSVATNATTAAFSVALLTSDLAGVGVRYAVRFHTNDLKKFDLTDDVTPISLEDLINAYDPAAAPAASTDWLDHEGRIVALEGSVASGVADGDKGDIVVSGSGTVWTIEDERIEDIIGAKVVAGSNVTVSYNDTTGETTIASTGGGGAGTVDTANSPNANEFARFTDADTIEGLTVAETKTALSLNLVDNTADASKPVSTATQTALDLKANALGADDNYVTDAEKVKLGNLSGTNTGDQNLAPYFHKTNDDTDDITEGVNKFATAAEKAKLANITVTQAVDLDTMESNIALKANDADVVHDTGSETVAGIKTFSSSPIVPTPTTDFQASTKKYVDDAIIGGGGYTDEQAQDAVGGMVDTSLVYADATPLLSRAALTGDVTAAEGSNATTIANDAVTNAKAANMAANTIKGRITGSTGDPEDLTAANVRTIINVADGATANDTDANLKARANHTGTQTASTISDFNTAALTAAPAETGATLGVLNNAAAAKTTPVNADTFPITDSEASNVIKKLSFTNLKAFLKTYFDTLYAAVLGADDNYVTDAEKVKLGNLSGTNTGDQTSIVGITGTIAQFNTAVSDADIAPAISSAITYYVCPSGQTVANYDGDGLNTSVTPSDANDGLTKATPLATIAAAVAKIAGRVLAAKVTIQLADCDAGKAYFPDEVDISNVCFGSNSSSILERAIADRLDTYPLGYVHINGNNTTPNNVNVTGAATAAGTTSTKDCAFLVRSSVLRVSGMMVNYFRTTGGTGLADTGAINAYKSVVYVETINCTSDHTGNSGSLVSGFFHSVICLGGTFNITNSQFVRANAGSLWQTYSPLGYASATCTHSGSALFMMMTNEFSHGMFQGGAWSFLGTGTYYAQAAWTGSKINWNADAATTITYNGANITGLFAAQSSSISEGAGVNMVVTLTSILRRAHARSGSYIHYGGTTAGTSADTADGGSVVANGSFPFVVKTTSPMTAFQDYNEISAPATPAASAIRLYAKDKAGVSELFYKNDAGTERDLSASGGSGDTLPIADTTAVVKGSADATKLVRIEADGLTTGTTRVITMPDANTTLPVASQVITYSGPTAARTVTLPDANFTAARTDAANTFTGTQTFSSAPNLSTMTTGSILFAAASGAVTQDNTNLFWNDTTNILNVGNPTSSLDFRVQVRGDGGFDGMLLQNEGNSMLNRMEVFSGTQAFHNPQFAAIRGRGTIASPAAVVSGDSLFTIDVTGQETASTQNTAARISVLADGTPGTNDMPGRMEFATTADGAASPTARLVIKSTGLTSLYSGAAVASAATITPTGNLFHVTGTTNITSVSGTNVIAGTKITIIFDGVLTFTDGSNLKLAGNFVTTADDTITLVWDGSAWFEVCRSVN
jgi:hypothetical protein